MPKPTKQEIEDLRNQAKLEEAYNKSLNTTEIPAARPAPRMPAPMPTAPASMPKKYAKGGFVRSADGIAQKGKTRGTMC